MTTQSPTFTRLPTDTRQIVAAAVEKAWAPLDAAHKAEIAKLKQRIRDLLKEDHVPAA